jgi:hypothetical protein
MCINIVFYCSVLFCAAVTEFAFGPVEWGVTDREVSLGEMWYSM